MSIKRTFRTVAIMLIMVLTISGVTENSYAFWATNVVPPVSDTTTGTITVGSWTTTIPTYDANTYYYVGDVVVYNGIYYTAKKEGYLKTPGVGSWKSDWQQN